jgi:hypothetical protein
MADAPEKPKPKVQPIKIEPRARWLAGSFGVAGFATGAVATFTRSVEAGPVALIGVGFLLFLMALSGYLPTRLKIGDNEAEFNQAIQNFVEATVEETPANERDQLLQYLTDLGQAFPQAANSGLSALVYEQVIIEMIREIAHDVRPQIKTMTTVGPGRSLDMMITGPHELRSAGVEISARMQHGRVWAERVYDRFSAIKATEGPNFSLLLVVEHHVNRSVEEWVRLHDDARIVNVRNREDFEVLRAAVIDLVGPLDPDL